MLTLGALTFLTPAVLIAAAILPLIWLLLRLTPPALRRMDFPAARLLFNLPPTERTSARTPPWLIALRIGLLILALLGLAEPVWTTHRDDGTGPLVIVMDDGWAAATHWDARVQSARTLLERAERHGRPAALITTAPTALPKPPPKILPAREVLALAATLRPQPWPTDRAAAAEQLRALDPGGPAEVAWIADGVATDGDVQMSAALQHLGAVTVIDAGGDAPLVLAPPHRSGDTEGAGRVAVTLRRVVEDDAAPDAFAVRAIDKDGHVLAQTTIPMEHGIRDGTGTLETPPELSNRIARFDVEGHPGAGTTVLADTRWQRRPVGIASTNANGISAPLLEDAFYIRQALTPFAEVRDGDLDALLSRPLAVLFMASGGRVLDSEIERMTRWVDGGGILVRFAGPGLNDNVNSLLPVHLRSGGRSFGGTLSWNEPAHLAPFPDTSPFRNMEVPADVTIATQVLAEPTPDLPAKTWAKLNDGTPLVTAERRGQGWVILFHVTATPEWSSLPLSGLFVEMLRRVVDVSAGVAATEERGDAADMLPPLQLLDGLGHLTAPDPAARSVPASAFATAKVGPGFPPGLYGAPGSTTALNLSPALADAASIHAWPSGARHVTFDGVAPERALKPYFLSAALILLLLDLVVSFILRGLMPTGARRSPAAAGVAGVMALLALSLSSGSAHAAESKAAPAIDPVTAAAILQTRLAYVVTGDSVIDRVAAAGLNTLTRVLAERTSAELAQPAAIDLNAPTLSADNLSPYPLIYWRVGPNQAPPNPKAAAALSAYLHRGGMVIFDAPEEAGAIGGHGAGARLENILRTIDLPPLTAMGSDHVLTRSFYLLRGLPGRFKDSTVYVNKGAATTDGVSSVIIGGNDWASAWAQDADKLPMYAMVPGGEAAREMAYRAGVNMVMYALTGNYKSDAVHLKAIMERLNSMTAAITFSPTVPLPLLAALAAMAAALLAYGLLRRARGTALRAIPILALLVALADPVLMSEHRTPLTDVAVVVVDETGSQHLGQRMERTTKAAAKLAAELAAQPNLDVRTVHVTGADQDGTRLFTALNETLDDVPAQRLAGTIMITDGQVHDAPTPAVHAPWQGAPVHVLLSGDHGEHDRRIRIERAPDFGLVGQTATVRVKIEDTDAPAGTEVPVSVRRNGAEPQNLTLPVGDSIELPVTIANVGANVFEIDVAPRDGELSLANNRALVSITGVRDRLKVLLISGQPHVGERAWRNLLKSDPNVNLVHFTILRPGDKAFGTPNNELSLIEFPAPELFGKRLRDFDLVIFDRYSQHGLLQFQFTPQIVNYVRNGGAVMLAVGPEYADSYSLYDSPLQSILPAAPTGQVSERPFQPQVSALGARHPVTAELTGAFANDANNGPTWGRWLRRVDVGTPSGETVMTGANNEPLLVLDRVGKGRVALLLSDTMWLWGKDFDGGGPQAELLRRVSHWLMKEPELEEESLTAEPHGDDLVITRHSIATDEKSVTVSKPSGIDETIVPQDAGHGRFVAKLTNAAPGFYRLTDGEHTAVAAVGAPNPLENYDVVTTDAKVGPIAEATGGGVYWLGNGDAPAVRRVAPGRTAHGASWVGLKANKQSAITGITQVHLAPVALLLAALMLGAMLAWWREGQ